MKIQKFILTTTTLSKLNVPKVSVEAFDTFEAAQLKMEYLFKNNISFRINQPLYENWLDNSAYLTTRQSEDGYDISFRIHPVTFEIDPVMIQNDHSIIVRWTTDDVIQMCKDRGYMISTESAAKVLKKAKANHDAAIGITWDVLDSNVDSKSEIKVEQSILENDELFNIAQAWIDSEFSDFLTINEIDYRCTNYGGSKPGESNVKFERIIAPESKSYDDSINWGDGFRIYSQLKKISENHYEGLEAIIQIADFRD